MPSDLGYMEFSVQGGEWDQMLAGWELGVGAEDARQMTSYFEQYQPLPQFGVLWDDMVAGGRAIRLRSGIIPPLRRGVAQEHR